jgi:very-short-patch-repair endonuclease
VVFPSPDKGKREVGLFYHYLPNTEYGRGESRKNPGEAKEVAEAIMHHAKTSPDLTLGVAAFSISQTEAVRDQLEMVRRQDPSCEGYFRSHPEEPFFIKNLENVQGDERDVIFISVGYGRTSEGRVSMNFGPLNHEGGERRLNVLITRARKRCEVFTNLKADDIDLGRTSARGVQVLKRFLEYADTGHLDIPIPSGGEAESPFEEAVSAGLRQLGYRVEHQVGTGGFFIDLAIIDEYQPGRYLLGIECDGATYHSAKSARDRDRLRQEVLENLGWEIHRIWSTDWFRNPRREMQRLEKGIDAAKRHRASQAQSERRSTDSQVQQAPAIERQKPKKEKDPALDIESYQTAKLNIALYKETLHEVSRHLMAAWIKDVVDTESPVHKDEVARRIANCAGVNRIGRRIRTAFSLGLEAAISGGFVTRRGLFLWRPGMKQPKLRSRSGLPNASRKIRLIAPEEIELAISKVVTSSYGIQRDMIPNEVCELFGFKRTTSDMNAVVDHIVMKLLNDGRILEDGRYISLGGVSIF